MNWQRGIGAAVLVVAAAIPLTAARQFPGSDTDASMDTSDLAKPPAHEPSLEAPAANQNPNLPAWAYAPRGAGTGAIDDSTAVTANKAMPAIVSQGNKALGIPACVTCHLANGSGRPDTASLAGLPVGYMLKQLEDFKADDRHNAVAGMTASQMVPIAAKISPEDAAAAVEYFAALKPVKSIKVVETDVVPKTHANNWTLVVDEAGGTEPIGDRVIELRDAASGYVAYVPTGTLKKGAELVGAEACTGCHARDLRNSGNVPALAGRSPSAMARQLYDFQSGARKDSNPSLSHLTDTDIVAVTGYLASLEP